ncbi:MAG: TasA family protein [Pseudonocardiaceae bacterium]
MRKKLAVGGLAVLGALAFGIAGTYAAFSDTEQGPNTLVQAGKLDLRLSNQNDALIEPISFKDLKPGDELFYFVQLTNDGTVPGKAKWAFENGQELENGCGAPEIAVGDTTCDPGPGELGSQLAVTFSQMSGPDCGGTPQAEDPEGFSPAFSVGFTPINGLELAPDESKCVKVGVRFKHLDDNNRNNRAQSDSSSFGFRFQLVS